jgi:hypothetical protein
MTPRCTHWPISTDGTMRLVFGTIKLLEVTDA